MVCSNPERSRSKGVSEDLEETIRIIQERRLAKQTNLQRAFSAYFHNVQEETRVKESVAYLAGIEKTIKESLKSLKKFDDYSMKIHDMPLGSMVYEASQDYRNLLRNSVKFESLKLSNPEHKIGRQDFENIKRYM